MCYLIGLSGSGCLVTGVLGIALKNGVLEVASIMMLLACIIFCIIDALIAVHQGSEENRVFNWVATLRSVRRPEEDDSYYDV